ncbi:MAG: class I adenylate-forming enzyme family protein, partial [Nitrosopumilaceae archaeon]
MKAIYDFLDESASRHPSKTAIIFEKEHVPYARLISKTRATSNFIQGCTRTGDVVSVISENSVELLITYFSILKSGCIAHLIPPQTSDENLLAQVKQTKPELLFSTNSLRDKISRSGCLSDTKFVDMKSIIHNDVSNDTKFSGNRYHDVSTIIFTSGTTAKPKGARLKHSNVITATQNIVDRLGIKNVDIEINTLQLSHSFGLGCTHAILSQGATAVIFRNTINLKGIVKIALDERATGFVGVPVTFRKLLDTCKDDFGSCSKHFRYLLTNSAPMPKETIMEIIDLFPNAKFYTYYGLTEASRSTFMLFNENLAKIESVGKPAPRVQIKIMDEHGKILSANQIGEIYISGPHVIDEYWNNPDADSKLRDGWLQTGDLGYFDSDGYLYLKGRKDDLINVGGEKVSSLEIENIIKQLDGISDVAVIGIPDNT